MEELGQGTIDFMKTLKRAADPKYALFLNLQVAIANPRQMAAESWQSL